ncbi:translation initiation factor 2 [Aspergillus ibericus CBS 121593]|uniref:Translation initiation factor IF-2, mitochondrial n=1 Tax=Aspergillus ibericus CBS 121593 TaxID=1448316 RepID=A0A395GSR8_9EURO|nr:mitochondrial translation initiation factor [Aspergillus ibericus CBS 121593]RAK98432.1 mitochondrial translation initiation factor [Aspergillus ibericus CBS 121593]
MHRRAALELSRRHGVEWSCATARRNAAFAPIVGLVPRRSFRSSLPHPDSEPPSNNPGDSDAGSAPAPAAPKFGNRWGSKTQRPLALSPAEQAIRDALVAKQQQEQLRQQQERQKRQQEEEKRRERQQRRREARQARTEQPWPSTRWREGRPRQPRESDHPPRRRPAPPVVEDEESLALQPDKSLEITINRIPEQVRSTSWNCPDCQKRCSGEQTVCPCCKAERPVLLANPKRPWAPPRYRRSEEDAVKIRRLGPSGPEKKDDDTDKNLDRREVAFREYAASVGRFAGARPVFDLDFEEKRRASENKEASAAKKEKPKSDTEDKQAKPAKPSDPWAWDASSLKNIRIRHDDDVEIRPKRRDNRKQRETGRSEEDEFDEDDEAERKKRREEKKRLKKEKARKKELQTAAPSPLYLPEFISVSNLADVIGVRPAQFVQRMEDMGFEDVTYDHVLDAETAGLIATEYNYEPIFDNGEEDLMAAPEPEDKSSLPPRPPVVTIMGHVDHGKTTILDWLRNSSIAASEHGGITQHIGAFSVAMPSGKTITFLDTPGHAAFLDMRRRGADVTDIVVLVVAADDSVKPQTIEAIKHATSANVPIIVAMSKMDKEGVNPEKVKQDLSMHDVHVEDYGGDVQAIGVSGKTGQGMLELEEAIVTLSEVLDHRADPNGNVEGWVVEGTTKSYGRVATMLIRRGTLRPGDIIVAGTTWTRVRTLRNEAGVAVPEATPGMPVEVDGWREQPEAGTEFLQADDEQHAKEVVEYRMDKVETHKLSEDMAAINEARREKLEKRRQEEAGKKVEETAPSGPKPVQFIIKADVGGSAEAVLNSVTAVGNNEVYANVLRSEVGPVSEFDIEHAATANGHIISFNMAIDPTISRMAEKRGVNIMDHNVIYKLTDEVKSILSEHLPPNVTQRVTGEAEVGQVFEISLKGRNKTFIAGCKVRNGTINRAKKVRVLRGQETIYDGSISSLKNVKKDVTEMRKDTECGIGFEGWTEFAVGDHIQCYEEIYEKRYL